MKARGRSAVKRILILVMIIGIICLGVNAVENYFSYRDNKEAAELVGIAETEESADKESKAGNGTAMKDEDADETVSNPQIEALKATDLEFLRQINEDVVGWIHIPDTRISYPIVQGTDNDYYLEHTWKKGKNSAGAIFMEWQNTSDFSDFNTIIYGHNRRNKELFGSLSKFKDPAYWEAHPSIYIVNDHGIYQYDIFAVAEAGVKTIIYGMNIQSDEKRDEFIQYALDNSVINTGLVPASDDKILTLSTCTERGYSTRWVVLGVLNSQESYEFEAEE